MDARLFESCWGGSSIWLQTFFVKLPRWGENLAAEPDKRGRIATAYQNRFGKRSWSKLNMTGSRITFFSFRDSWEDAANNADLPQTHRRELAGCSTAGDSQAGYGDGPKMAAMKISLDKVNPMAI